MFTQIYRGSPEISPGLICRKRPFTENRTDLIKIQDHCPVIGVLSSIWGILLAIIEKLLIVSHAMGGSKRT